MTPRADDLLSTLNSPRKVGYHSRLVVLDLESLSLFGIKEWSTHTEYPWCLKSKDQIHYWDDEITVWQ